MGACIGVESNYYNTYPLAALTLKVFDAVLWLLLKQKKDVP